MSDDIRHGFKIFTHDRCPPVQGGPPVWDGTIPFELPAVLLDTSGEECAAGYNFCADLPTALRIAGLWPNGRPSSAYVVTAGEDAIQRGDKRRASVLTLERQCTDGEIHDAIHVLSAKWFSDLAGEMAAEQIAWREALGRPEWSVGQVEDGLAKALEARGLKWNLKRFDSAWDAWDARDARDAWDAWDAWDARDARDARDAWDAWDAWDARDARAAWAARDALTVNYASRRGWVQSPPGLLTDGLRDAYRNGLVIALPTGRDELGYAMVEQPAQGEPAASDAEAVPA